MTCLNLFTQLLDEGYVADDHNNTRAYCVFLISASAYASAHAWRVKSIHWILSVAGSLIGNQNSARAYCCSTTHSCGKGPGKADNHHIVSVAFLHFAEQRLASEMK